MVRILLLPGDGIGPEVTVEARRVLEAAAARFDLALSFEEELIGGASIDALGTPLSDDAMARARGSGSSDLKMPEPTKTPSAPNCIIRAASAGVARPPAAKLTTGRRPASRTSRTSS